MANHENDETFNSNAVLIVFEDKAIPAPPGTLAPPRPANRPREIPEEKNPKGDATPPTNEGTDSPPKE